jgi:3-hydroxybutyryl-CoA dehydratase
MIEIHRTVTEADVTQFAGITGDLNRIHLDEIYARSTRVGGRVAHGVYVQGLMATACTAWADRAGLSIVSYGWDRVRFIRPVLIGDTITAAYAMNDPDADGQKRVARADAHNQRGELVAVGTHILYVLN